VFLSASTSVAAVIETALVLHFLSHEENKDVCKNKVGITSTVAGTTGSAISLHVHVHLPQWK
jgi:hypothetical protein